MSNTAERVALACPACSPGEQTVHEVLSPRGTPTVRCTDCSHVHRTDIPETATVTRSVVVSQDGESFSTSVEVPEDEQLAVGEEFLVETEEAILTARITSLELAEGRSEEADAGAVETIWTRGVGNVSVRATVHPKSGEHDQTRGVKLQVPGDYEFVVGATEDLGGEEFTVEGLYLREDARGYEHDKLDHDGDSAVAKDIKRLYVRDESTSAWSAW